MKINSYTLYLNLRTISPLHIAGAFEYSYNLATGWGSMGSGGEEGRKNSIPCTGIQKMPVQIVSEDGSISTQNFPVIPGNNLMGHLRGHAAALVLDELNSRGEKINMPAFNGLLCGATSGNPDGTPADYMEYRRTRAHPYMGLFGGGPRMMRRYVRGINSVPLTTDTKANYYAGRLANPLHDVCKISDIKHSRMTHHWTFNRNDHLSALTNMELAEAAIENFDEELAKRNQDILANEAKKAKADKDDEKNNRITTRSFSAMEFSIPGLTFPEAFFLEVTESQLGLFLACLERFVATDTLGGHGRNGFGHFVVDDNSSMLIEHGAGPGGSDLVSRDIFENGRLNLDIELVDKAVRAWDEVKQEMTGAEINEFMALSKAGEKKIEDKKNKAAEKKAKKEAEAAAKAAAEAA